MNTSKIPRLLITAGEPAGIGPELCLQIALLDWPAEIIVCADQELLKQYNVALDLNVEIVEWQPGEAIQSHQAAKIYCYQVTLPVRTTPGTLDAANGGYVLETLQKAAELVQSNQVDALITAPVHKGIINEAGFAFTGHTEFFANLANTKPVMMLTCPEFRVALATTHLSLREVPDAITGELLTEIISILDSDLKTKYHISEPTIHVCGLNPHAGESGHMGKEEIDVIEPVLEQMRSEGYRLKGPLAADTALTPKGMKGSDVTLAMYHDQGLSVLKFAGFGRAVNVTLGLPFIRVSVDHGTALDLAGKGVADVGSLKAALSEAILMASSLDD